MNITPLPWQQRLLAVPEDVNIALVGGRGGGKSTGAGLLTLRHHVQYGERAKTLITRPDTHAGLADFADQMEQLFVAGFGRSRVSRNRQEHMIRIHEAGTVEFAALDSDTYDKFQGRQFSQLIADEAGNFTTFRHLDRLRSNLRMPGIPTRLVLVANPGGVAHAELARRYVTGRTSWHPYVAKDGETWVSVSTTLADNAFLDAEQYTKRLAAAVGNDEALLKAWVSGNWSAISGAFFAKSMSDALWIPQSADEIAAWCRAIKARPRQWQPSLSIDWGWSAPSVVEFGMRALVNGAIGAYDRPYSAGSLAVIDEITSVEGDDPNEGGGWSPSMLAEAIHERRTERWAGFDPVGVVDDARGLDGSTLIEQLRKLGLTLRRPKKDRNSGWVKTKGMMVATRDGDADKPQLLISERCRYLAETLPVLKRSSIRPEDIVQSPKQPDHGADALRYLCCDEPVQQSSGGGVEIVRSR